jgi:FkbM family methyltransferase
MVFELDLRDSTQRYTYYWNDFEPDVRIKIQSLLRPQDIVIDAGANFGFHSLIAARLVGASGRVFAFEPLPRAYRCLKRNLALNGIENVVAENLALGDRESIAPIYTFTDQPDTHASMYAAVGGVSEAFECRVITLDSYVQDNLPDRRIRLIKLDVEGYELTVLKGASSVLDQMRPDLIVEFNPRTSAAAGYTQQELMDFLVQRGYSLQLLTVKSGQAPVLHSISQLSDKHSTNVYAFHKGSPR